MRRNVGWEVWRQKRASKGHLEGLAWTKNVTCHFSKQRVLWPAATAAAPCSPTALWREFRMEKNRILNLDFCCCSVTQLCLTICDPMDCSTPGFPVLHHLLELAQTHVHWLGDAIQSSHLLSSPSPHAFNLSHHQGLFQWVSSLHQMVEVLELQHQSFQWIFRVDFL